MGNGGRGRKCGLGHRDGQQGFWQGVSKQNGWAVAALRVVCKRHPCRIQTRQDILVLTPLGFRAFC